MKDTPNGHIETELATTLTRFLVVFMASFGSSRRPLPLRNLGIGCLPEEVLLHNARSKNMIEASAVVSVLGIGCLPEEVLLHNARSKNMIEASAVVSVSSNLDFPSMKHLSSVVHIQKI